MKFWIVLALAGVGAYFAWFRPEKSETHPASAALKSGGSVAPAPADAGNAAPKDSRVRLDIGGGKEAAAAAPASKTVDPAHKLEVAREEALRAGDAKKAEAIGAEIVSKFPQSDGARLIDFERGRRALAKYRRLGKCADGLEAAERARKLLTPALFLANARTADREALRKTLQDLAHDVLFTHRHVEGADFVYVPKRGDNLSTLCRKVFPKRGTHVETGLVADVNGITPRALRAGRAIRVPLGVAEIVVRKSEYRLYFLLDGAYVKDWPVGLGREGRTPTTEFVIVTKTMNPDWYEPGTGKKIPYGDPADILGTRWMGFKNSARYSGFGIHGTADPSSIGKSESSGCIRMGRAAVEELFSWTPIGTRVRILD